MPKKDKPDLTNFLEEVIYYFDSKAKGFYPGKWRSKTKHGSGFSFEKFEKFSNFPDFRKIDFLTTARNVLSKEMLVRLFKQTARIDTIMLADLSNSMNFASTEPKYWQIAKLATLFGYTAYRFGDKFGFVGCDKKVVGDLVFAPVKLKTYGLEIGESLLDFRPSVCSSEGLLEAFCYLKPGRTLVVLVSDFYFEERLLYQILEGLEGCQILPVVLRYEIEKDWRGCFGLARFRDMETKATKTFFLTPKSVKKFREASRAHEEKIKRIFQETCLSPVVVSTGEITALEIISQIQGEEV